MRAPLVRIEYDASVPLTDMDAQAAAAYAAQDCARPASRFGTGDFADRPRMRRLSASKQTYTTPVENHNPMEPHATIAVWDGR